MEVLYIIRLYRTGPEPLKIWNCTLEITELIYSENNEQSIDLIITCSSILHRQFIIGARSSSVYLSNYIFILVYHWFSNEQLIYKSIINWVLKLFKSWINTQGNHLSNFLMEGMDSISVSYIPSYSSHHAPKIQVFRSV